MIICSKCNKELQDDAQFCDNCGTAVAKTEVNTELAAAVKTEESTETPVSVKTKVNAGTDSPAKKKSFLVPALIGAGALVLLVLLGVFFVGNLGGTSSKKKVVPRGLYIKDKELHVSDFSKKGVTELTSNFVNSEDGFDVMDYVGYDMSSAVHFSKNGNILFYPEKINGSGYTLYCKDISKPKKEPIKIDSGVSTGYKFYVSDDNNIVTYVKNDSIYQYNMNKKDKVKIDSGLRNPGSFYVEDNGKKIFYVKENGTLYFKKAGKDKEKIDSNIDRVITADYKNNKVVGVIYLKDDKLYKKEEGKEKEKIASDVTDIISEFKGGEFYYTKEEKGGSGVLMDYVEDDMKEQDADIEDPGDEPKYPSLLDYGSVAAYQKAVDEYNEAYDEYLKAEDKYEAKRDRDTLRQELKEEEISNSGKTLYYYDGKKENKVSDNFGTLESRTYKKPILVFSVSESKEREKVKLSKIESIYDVYDELGYDYLSTSSGKMAIAIGDKVSDIEGENIKTATISREGNHLYFVTNIKKNKNYGDLYEVKVKNGKLEKAKLYDEDVCYEMIGVSGDSQVLYFKDYKNSEGTLYINKKEVDEDVYSYVMIGNYSSKEIFYYVDYNSDKDKGSLRVYNGKKAKTIAEDVNDFEVFDDGSVMYLYDYSINKNKGDLNYYKNGKNKKIDEDVTAIFDYLDYSLAN